MHVSVFSRSSVTATSIRAQFEVTIVFEEAAAVVPFAFEFLLVTIPCQLNDFVYSVRRYCHRTGLAVSLRETHTASLLRIGPVDRIVTITVCACSVHCGSCRIEIQG
jgi:hypothetical protein